MSCISETSLKHCTCTYEGCDKRGNCCKCVAFHLGKNEIPGCFFTPEGEARYDRSLAHLFRDRAGDM